MAVRVVDDPAQIVTLDDMFTVGRLHKFTVMGNTADDVPVPQLFTPATVKFPDVA